MQLFALLGFIQTFRKVQKGECYRILYLNFI